MRCNIHTVTRNGVEVSTMPPRNMPDHEHVTCPRCGRYVEGPHQRRVGTGPLVPAGLTYFERECTPCSLVFSYCVPADKE